MSKAAELANLIGNINAGGGGVNRNVIINGAMNVAQRGTSSTGVGASSGYFVCDRWNFYSNGTDGRVTITQDSSAPEGFANSLKIATTTVDTSVAAGEQVMLMQRIEGQNLQHFKKGTSNANPWALSFYVKGNASATYIAELMDNDNSSRHVGKAFNVTTDWTRVEITLPADTTGTLDDDNASSIDFSIHLHNGSTFTSGTLQETWGALAQANRGVGGSSILDSTDRTFFITGVQLEVGQNATEFEHEPFDRTLVKCKRYFQKVPIKDRTLVHYSSYAYGYGGNITYQVPMRAAPSSSGGGNCTVYPNGYTGGAITTSATFTLQNPTSNGTQAYVQDSNMSNSYSAYFVRSDDILLDAEL